MEKKTTTKAAIKKMSVLELIDEIVHLTNDNGINLESPAKPFINELSERLSLTPMEALFTSVIIDMYYDTHTINYKEIAHHFDVRPVTIIGQGDVRN